MRSSIPIDVARERARRGAEFLARDPRVRLVFLFGSTADEDVEGVRDIDLAIRTEPRLDLGTLMRLRADLVAAVGGGFDLVSLNDASVVLAKEIANSGRCLFAIDGDEEVDFVTGARFRFFDFKPFLEVQRRYAAKRAALRLARADGSQT